MEYDKLTREAVKKLIAYEPLEIQADEDWLRLDTNENPFPILPEIIEELKEALESPKLIKHPDPLALEVRKAILNQLLRDKQTLTDRNTIMVGNGIDEILDILFKVYVNPGDQVIIFYPSYSLYKVLANLYEAKIIELKLNEDFSIPKDAFTSKGKIMFINSPNDPNGKSFDNKTIQQLCESFPGMIVVDEEYADFSDITCLSLLKEKSNLIVCRSLSRTFSLPALNTGYALSNAAVIKEMNRVKLPYNTSFIAQQAAISSIKHRRKIFIQNQKIINERERITEELGQYDGIAILPSDANFICIKFKDKSKTLKFLWDLKELKIMVRHFSKPNLYNYLRVTVAKKEDNDKFLKAFHSIAEKYL